MKLSAFGGVICWSAGLCMLGGVIAMGCDQIESEPAGPSKLVATCQATRNCPGRIGVFIWVREDCTPDRHEEIIRELDRHCTLQPQARPAPPTAEPTP
jgi:hypothetical protein